jgi:hypothetical protein
LHQVPLRIDQRAIQIEQQRFQFAVKFIRHIFLF